MEDRHDAIIIGAGVIGAATALELARLGYRCLGLDRLPAAGYGSTSNSCAIVRVHYSTFDGIALAWESYHYWHDWAKYLEVPASHDIARFVECGCLVMKTEHNHYLEKHLRLSDELGIPYEQWSAQMIRKRLPIYDTRRFGPPRAMNDDDFDKATGSELAGGVFWPTAGYVSDPQFCTRNLQSAAEAKGAEFRFGCEVVSILKSDDGRVRGVRLEDGTEIASNIVVNIAGPHSAVINEMAGADEDMTITTRALRQEVVHVPAPEGFDFERLGMVVSDSDIGCYVRPETGNNILIGSEDPECDPREFVDPDDYQSNFTEQSLTQACRYALRVPNLGIPSTPRGAVDLYDVSDDWIPIYDKSGIPGFYMAIGTSGNQFKNAPVAGKMMAALIDHCEKGHDHDLQPLSFHLTHIDRDIDMGFYSRRRSINNESSFSVLG
ncbi:NAD(P)/FAD-dependent oxidoreductase [Thioalkalivibrio sp. HK1]|uniref:NAD(P)/FAD-dependent oxidoreductase n=1 Tax=Thioalkalivibrio sp. HK1 TaxID=1469245 RepID=UPI00046F67E5|nr:FAD-dependent oxidoreductase [Thioalkalivibrio sp. HK1]